jgi:oligosaccharyl transferase (archaeosortase A-associated)
MRRELILLIGIAAVALAVRIYPAYGTVFGGDEVNFVETDAWYHVRLVENQVRNYPWRVTVDPYAADGGQFVPIAPLYDTLTATAVVLLRGTSAATSAIERIAAFVPAVLGMLAVVAGWAVGRQLFGSSAGLLGALLLATMPGHFLDRTTLGFVDHHALEALLALVTLVFLARGSQAAPGDRALLTQSAAAGLALGLYLLTWASGAFFVTILGVWLFVVALLSPPGGQLARTARLLGIAALVALVLVVTFQDPAMYRYATQVLALGGLGLQCLVVHTAARFEGSLPPRTAVLAGTLLVLVVGALAVWLSKPDLFHQVTVDVRRFTPDASRMAVLEARPLFLYSGQWNWWQPWIFFRFGFYVGLMALILFTATVVHERQPAHALVWTFAVASLAATLGQNRFAYYLVPAFAILGGWLGDRVLAWGGWFRDRQPDAPAPLQRELALVAVAATMFAPSLSAVAHADARMSGIAPFWLDAMFWLRHHTPEPFAAAGGDSYYYARYPRHPAAPEYTVMNWWDYGYLLTQRARRVPVANPTQERAAVAARFFVETDEANAVAQLRESRARYVVADWELPFRYTSERRIMGRLESVLDWAGRSHGDYFEVWFRRGPDGWTAVWVFHEPYYRSMIFRLVVAGGAAVTPRKVSVITTAARVDSRGQPFREILDEQIFNSYEDAQRMASSAGPGNTRVVGLDPRQSAFPLEALTSFERLQDVRTLGQPMSDPAWVRIYQVVQVPEVTQVPQVR